jgi:hypothetical protein
MDYVLIAGTSSFGMTVSDEDVLDFSASGSMALRLFCVG